MALADLRALEKSKKFKINMDDWFVRTENTKGKEICTVCHAGACLARSINGPVTEGQDYLSPYNFRDEGSTEIERKFSNFLYAVNSLREGDMTCAAKELGLKPDFFKDLPLRKNKEPYQLYGDEGTYFKMPDYHKNRKAYHRAFKKIVKYVEQKGR